MRLHALALYAALVATAAHADTVLTPVSAEIMLDSNYQFAYYPGFSAQPQTLTFSGATGIAANQSGTDPQVSSSISVAGLPSNGGAEALSYLFYEFAVNGPADQTVSVSFSSNGSATVSALGSGLQFNSTAYLEVSDMSDGTVLLSQSACAGDPNSQEDPCDSTSGPASSSFDVAQTLSVQTDTVYLVNILSDDSLFASAGAVSGNYSASSSVDPTITLDSSDPAYSLAFSPGLFPSATPEPSSLVLLGTGLAGVLMLARRRLLSI